VNEKAEKSMKRAGTEEEKASTPSVGKVNLFIIGAAKSGTTSVYTRLSQHKDIFAGKLKEPHYFAKDHFLNTSQDHKKTITMDYKAYVDNYKDAGNEKYRIDASVYYMYYEDSLPRIKEYNANAKILITLRNPVDRIYSHYKMLFNKGFTKANFENFLQNPVDNIGINLLKLGEYCRMIEYVYQVFEKDNVLLLDFEDLTRNETVFYEKITNFLDIQPFKGNMDSVKENVSHIPKNQFLRYLHVDFFITKALKKIIPKGKIRRRFGEAIVSSFYKKDEINRETKNDLYNYYKEDLQGLKNYGIDFGGE
jgi:hypothetical protein